MRSLIGNFRGRLRGGAILLASTIAASGLMVAPARAAGCAAGDPTVMMNEKTHTYVYEMNPSPTAAGSLSNAGAGGSTEMHVMCESAAKAMGGKPLMGSTESSMLRMMMALNAAGLSATQQKKAAGDLDAAMMAAMKRIESEMTQAQRTRFQALIQQPVLPPPSAR